jgi:hypothetical protein
MIRTEGMQNDRIAQGWIALAGFVLVAVGLLGFLNNPLVGPDTALIPTGTVHNLVHLVTGILALYIAFGLRGLAQANAVVGFGVLYAIIFVVVLLSPTLFGLFEFSANAYLHVIHAALAVVSLAVGYMARNALVGSAQPGSLTTR